MVVFLSVWLFSNVRIVYAPDKLEGRVIVIRENFFPIPKVEKDHCCLVKPGATSPWITPVFWVRASGLKGAERDVVVTKPSAISEAVVISDRAVKVRINSDPTIVAAGNLEASFEVRDPPKQYSIKFDNPSLSRSAVGLCILTRTVRLTLDPPEV
jgi:hypothetical protein